MLQKFHQEELQIPDTSVPGLIPPLPCCFPDPNKDISVMVAAIRVSHDPTAWYRVNTALVILDWTVRPQGSRSR